MAIDAIPGKPTVVGIDADLTTTAATRVAAKSGPAEKVTPGVVTLSNEGMSATAHGGQDVSLTQSNVVKILNDLDPGPLAGTSAALGDVDFELRAMSSTSMAGLSAEQHKDLSPVISSAANFANGKASIDGASNDFRSFLNKNAGGGLPTDVNAMVQFVLRQSYTESTKDLKFYATKVKFFNNVKKQIREELKRARDVRSQTAGAEPTDSLRDLTGKDFAGNTIGDTFFGQTEAGISTNEEIVETIDTSFTGAEFKGDQAGAGSSVDPVAIRLGDGPAVIDTPNGSFVVDHKSSWKDGPNIKTSGGLADFETQMLAMANDSDTSNDVFVPSLRADKNPDGTMGYWDGKAPKPGPADIQAWVKQEIEANRITLTGAAAARYDSSKPLSEQTVGIVDIKIVYYEEFRTTQWFGPDMGILVQDLDGDGQIQANELFGDTEMTGRAGLENGYQDLARYDVNGDGKISAADGTVFNELAVWQDLNSDGKVDPGEMRTLGQVGLTEISVQGTATGATNGVIMTSTARMTDVATVADLDNYMEDLEQQLNSVGDDAQLANVDLQNMLQKQQQTLQMMSNISKMLHDTSMAIIRKIGG